MEKELRRIIPEATLLEVLNIKRQTLDTLRQRGLPFIRATSQSRFYYEEDVFDFLLSNRVCGTSEDDTIE